jgi:hypothetical protein
MKKCERAELRYHTFLTLTPYGGEWSANDIHFTQLLGATLKYTKYDVDRSAYLHVFNCIQLVVAGVACTWNILTVSNLISE